MQKTYWWRILVALISGGIVFIGWIYDNYLCFTVNNSNCPFDKYRLIFIEPVILFSIFIFIISLILVLVNDNIFKKWLKFALVWFVITAIFIIFAPVSTGGWMSFGPTKESVSIWMGSLFIILSLVKIGWDWRKEKMG